MTDKRFENRLNKDNVKFNTLNPVWDNEKQDALNVFEMIDLLNELHEENKKLKTILQDIGLMMSDEEVKNVRDEIASKLIKPLCKENGFDVDVNTENGFTIIPKGDVE